VRGPASSAVGAGAADADEIRKTAANGNRERGVREGEEERERKRTVMTCGPHLTLHGDIASTSAKTAR
jgi:hypothetical protein